MDYIGNRNFLERDAVAAADRQADRLAEADRTDVRVCCPWCGSAGGWEQWDRWQAGLIRDSVLLAVGVLLLTGERIGWYPLPTFYRRNGDGDHLYVPCWRCKPPTDGAVAMDAEAVQEWLEGEL